MNVSVKVEGQHGLLMAHVTVDGNEVAVIMLENFVDFKMAWYKVKNGLIVSEWIACDGKTIDEAFCSFISRIAVGMPALKKALKEGFNDAEWMKPADRYKSTISAKMADRYDII